MELIEQTILHGLLTDEDFFRRTYPFLECDYFSETGKHIFLMVKEYVSEYNKPPNKEVMAIILDRTDLSENIFVDVDDFITNLNPQKIKDTEFLVNETEEWCQNQAVFNAVSEAIQIIEGDDESQKSKHSIPTLLKDALGVNFDTDIGLSFFDDIEKQYNYYNDETEKFKFDIDIMNSVTNGGIPNKTLNVFLGPINFGKSIWLAHQASHWLRQGKNVLVISLEMFEEALRERIDANMLDIETSQLYDMSFEDYSKRMHSIRKKNTGNLVIKQYPTGKGHAGHFRHLIEELQLKKNFKPDVLIIDYIGICASSELSGSARANSNLYYTQVATELRALGIEFDIPVWTAHQIQRNSQSSSSPEMDNVADAIGIAAVADFIIAGYDNEELEEQKKAIIKQLKNRYNKKSVNRMFVIGLDRDKMKFYDTDNDYFEEDVDDARQQVEDKKKTNKSVNDWKT